MTEKVYSIDGEKFYDIEYFIDMVEDVYEKGDTVLAYVGDKGTDDSDLNELKQLLVEYFKKKDYEISFSPVANIREIEFKAGDSQSIIQDSIH